MARADPVETFHLSFLKSILRVKKSTPNCFVYGELGQYPLALERKIKVIKFWIKIVSQDLECNSLVFKIYQEQLRLCNLNPNLVTWASLVRDMLNKYGLGNYWVAQNVGDKKVFLEFFKRRMYDVFLQEWNASVSATSEARLFKHIKIDFAFETYLDVLCKSLRIATTRIRLSSHMFMIERGRWTKVAREDRLCTVCSKVEDEYHCLVTCPRFVNERRGRLNEHLLARPSMYEFVKFLRSKSPIDIKNVGLLCLSVQIEYNNFV